jgi:hypothetical protein
MQKSSRFTLRFIGLLIFAATLTAAPQITEFMASNKEAFLDSDGEPSDWIEIHNPDTAAVNLDGWYLTDNASDKTKWRLPAVVIPADGYVVVFASSKNRVDPSQPLHTNFSLSAGGEYLGLVQTDGTTVASEYTPKYPAQSDDISYGITQPLSAETPQVGFFSDPTPGQRNGDASALVITETVAYSRSSGLFTNSLSLELAGAAPDQTIRYVLAPPSAAGGAVPDPTNASPEYTAPLTINETVVVKAAVFSADGARHGRATWRHFVKVDTATAQRLDTFSSQLPLVVLDNHGFGPMVKDEIGRPAWLYGFLPGSDGQTTLSGAPDYASPLELEVRGSTSSLYPKKSYKFDLIDDFGNDAPLPLFGLENLEDWNLVGPWSYDRSYIRNAVAYDLSRRMGHWAPRTRLVEVFFNQNGGNLDAGDYAGVYLLVDKIEVDAKRIDITELDTDDIGASSITGGYVLRADEADPEKYSWTTDRGLPEGDGSVFMVEEPKIDDLAPEQRAYIRDYVQDMEDALFTDRASGWATRSYLNYIDRSSWVDHHMLNTLVKNTDAFWRSAYLTKDRGGKIMAGPVWDFDRSMDSTDPRDNEPDTWHLTKFTSQGFAIQYWETGWWGVLARDPDFMQEWVDRWQTLRLDEFSRASLAGIVHGFGDQIGDEAAARDVAKWPDNQSPHGDFADEIEHISTWLTTRADWIDTQFVSRPLVTLHEGRFVITPPAGAAIAYTLDGTDPRLSGGEVSTTATLSTTPQTFSLSANVRVRSYDASQANAFPGSPWSSLRIASPHDLDDTSNRPIIADGATTAAAIVGKPVTLSATVSGVGPFTYQWYKDDEAIPGATSATLSFNSATALDSGIYVLRASNAFGWTVGAPIELDVQPGARLVNISARAEVGSGENVLIAGFVVEGSGTKNFLARAVGSSLTGQGISNPMTAPTLKLFAKNGTVLFENTKWSTSPAAAEITQKSAQVGAFPLLPGGDDSALLAGLDDNIYTVHALPAQNGVGLIELYALDDESAPTNLSARARVRSGERLLIGGFVIAGTEPMKVLIRAVGPTLAPAGVASPLADPVLELVSKGQQIHLNDDWQTAGNATDVVTAATAVGALALPEGSKDSSLLVTLPPGVYSALVRGKDEAEGVALLEIYVVHE